jgi:hypothetical protein
MVTPCLRAAVASAGTAIDGSARPSLGVCRPPAHVSALPGMRAATSAGVSTVEWTCISRAIAAQRSQLASSSLLLVRNNTPVRRKPASAPASFCMSSHRRNASRASGISSRARPCCRHQPQLRLDCSPPTWPFSISATECPFFAR